MATRLTALRIAGWSTLVSWSVVVAAVAFGEPASLNEAEVQRDYVIRTWRHEHGLPDNTVPALLQTRDNYLWVGTRAGLARYDGLRFVVFNRANTPAMFNEVCQALAEDREGGLWVGTEDGLLCRRGNHWTRYETKDGLPATNIWSVCVTHDGNVWAGTDLGLARVTSGKIEVFDGTNGPGRCRVLALHEDSEGSLWIGSSRGLFRYEIESGRLIREVQPPSAPSPYPPHVSGVFRDTSGALWAASAKTSEHFEAEIYRFQGGTWDYPSWLRPVCGYSVAAQWPVTFAAGPDGTLWIPGIEPALWRISNTEAISFPLPVPLANGPLALCCDREGNLWAGLHKAGLLCVERRRIQLVTAADGLPHDIAWTICEAHDGSRWIGTDGGVSQFKDGRIETFSQTNGLSRNEVRAVVETSDGSIWVGTLNGLDSIRDGKISHVRFPGEWEETKIRALLPARNGGLWVGTVRGLTRLQDGQRTNYTPADGLGADEVRALLEDHEGNLWAGTFGGGLSCLRQNKFTTLTTTNGLSHNNVWALHEDAEGVLWVGTERGLNRVQKGNITVFTTREGLPNDTINALLEDDRGRLWIGHDRGIYWVAKDELNQVAVGRARSVHAVQYDQTDGLAVSEVNGQKSFPSACKTRDGRLWFPTVKGVAVINPAKVAPDATAPVTVIEQIRAGGKVVFDNGPSTTPVNTPVDNKLRNLRLRLPPGRGQVLEFRYTACALAAPDKVRFKHRMTGLEKNWIEIGTRREVLFPNLPPGDYEFEVIAASHHGVWADHGARAAVHLAPFFYQTSWFFAACACGGATLVGGIVTWRIRGLRRLSRLEQQNAIIAERARIAKDLHDGLGADLSRLTLLADLASGESGAGSGEHARKLSRTSRQAASDLKDLIWLANPANDTVEGVVSRICQTAEDLLRDARIRCRFDIPGRLPQTSPSLGERRDLLLVVREALNNIIKHASASEVRIRAQCRAEELELSVSDNGRGFDPKAIPPGTLGLLSMRRRMENLGGSFQVESQLGAGTRIMIQLKLNGNRNEPAR